jgi:DNA primase
MKDPADLFAAQGEEALKTLEELKRASEDLIDIEAAEAAAQLDDPRRKREYAVERIVPLACELNSETAQKAALDITAEKLEGVKAAWLNNALKEERKRREEATILRAVKINAEAAAEAQRSYLAKVDAAAEEIAEIFARPGVLDRLQRDAAEMHGLVGDEHAIKLIALVALGAQLKPLPNGRPLGPSVLLAGPPGAARTTSPMPWCSTSFRRSSTSPSRSPARKPSTTP